MRRILPRFCSCFVCAPAGAQTLGTITGEVKDSSGGVMPGATVTVTNTGTNATAKRRATKRELRAPRCRPDPIR